MAINGTADYASESSLPPLVAAAVDAARHAGFTKSCLPQQGRLLQLPAAGVGAGRIGETGTGYGVGLAWMASMAHPDAELFSVECDPSPARQAEVVFAADRRCMFAAVTGGIWPARLRSTCWSSTVAGKAKRRKRR